MYIYAFAINIPFFCEKCTSSFLRILYYSPCTVFDLQTGLYFYVLTLRHPHPHTRVCICMNNSSSKTTGPRDMLFFLKVTLSLSYIPSYVHVHSGYRENRLIGKGHLSYTCDFIKEYQGGTDPAMKIGMHIFSASTQWSCKIIHISRVTSERVAHVHSTC